ncbi:MAG: hypothetical protein RL339_79 [Pseudomonadota bacterium]
MQSSIALPQAPLGIGVTGHSADNAAYAANSGAIAQTVAGIFDLIGTARLHSLLARGTDLAAAEVALARGWELVALLPFGIDLNIAINVHPGTAEEARALLAGQAAGNPVLDKRAADFHRLAARAHQFELAEADELLAGLFLQMLDQPGNAKAATAFSTVASERVATAGRVMIEQSDLILAVWDGIAPGPVGGTRHTIASALDQGVPVLWIDASNPTALRLLQSPEALAVPGPAATLADVAPAIEAWVNPPADEQNERAIAFHTEQWHPRSLRRFHAYRRIEAMFGGTGKPLASLVQRYQQPEEMARTAGTAMMADAEALPGSDLTHAQQIRDQVLTRFAWADGLSTFLSDAYRGGMVMNFFLSALAIVGGVAYLPFFGAEAKWPFALFEFVMLGAILAITATGRKRRWHGRWFETRRIAEYFRHAPALLMLGVARPVGHWPRGVGTQWPEHYVRKTLRGLGLPQMRVTQAYLRAALDRLLGRHARAQRDYHRQKAARLTRVHHNLDHGSEWLFRLAVVSVALYLRGAGLASAGLVPAEAAMKASKTFTFLGVAFPALGGAFAGIRYFGDFERFAAISEVTAGKLDVIIERIDRLSADPASQLSYAQVAGLAHMIDDVVIDEIESWQAVFAGKNITVPV